MKTALRFSLVTLLALGVAACGNPTVSDIGAPAGDDDDDGGTPPPGPDPSVSITSSGTSLDLRDAKTLDFTVTGFNGFTGDVTVTASGLPAGVTANSAMVTIATANGTAAGSLNLTSDYMLVSPGDYSAVKVVATAGAVTADDIAPIAINPILSFDTKAPGTGSIADMWGAANTGDGIVVHRGSANILTVNFKNMELAGGAEHLIHGPGAGTLGGTVDGTATTGFKHGTIGSAEGAPQGIQTRTLNVSGVTANTVVLFYCHTHGEAAQPAKMTVMP